MIDFGGNWPQWVTDLVNWFCETVVDIQTTPYSVKTTKSSITANGPSITASVQKGAYTGQTSAKVGLFSGMFRAQWNKKPAVSPKLIIGAFGKASLFNNSSKHRIGTKNVGVSQKTVIDVGTVSANAGIRFDETGVGIGLGAKTAVATARGTYCIDVFGWELEVGMDASYRSYGYEVAYGKLPEGGYGVKKSGSFGKFGFGYIIRLTPP